MLPDLAQSAQRTQRNSFILDRLYPFVTLCEKSNWSVDTLSSRRILCRSTLDVASHDCEVALEAIQPRDPREQSPVLEPEPLK